MSNLLTSRWTHSQRLERWLGVEAVEKLSKVTTNWYGPPIAVAGVPGSVWACKGGDFKGVIGAGQFGHALDYTRDRLRGRFRRWAQQQQGQCNAGFASLGALISAANAGQRRLYDFQKAGVGGGVVGMHTSLWGVGANPVSGQAGNSAPGGTVYDDTSQGAYPLDTLSPFTRHLVGGSVLGNPSGGTLLLYDRLFAVAKTINSTATEAVTGVPTRYQSTTATAADYAGGNFVTIEVTGTNLAGTAHNWTVCLYTNQAGTTSRTFQTVGGGAIAVAARRLDMPAMQWFIPPQTGDIGVKALTQMQCDTLVATGSLNFVHGHPLALFPIPIANVVCLWDGITSAFSLQRIFDGACLAWLDINRPVTAVANYQMSVVAVFG